MQEGFIEPAQRLAVDFRNLLSLGLQRSGLLQPRVQRRVRLLAARLPQPAIGNAGQLTPAA